MQWTLPGDVWQWQGAVAASQPCNCEGNSPVLYNALCYQCIWILYFVFLQLDITTKHPFPVPI
jgi:hypothetical protein